MKLLEDIVLTDSIEIHTTPEKVFGFFLDNYRPMRSQLCLVMI